MTKEDVVKLSQERAQIEALKIAVRCLIMKDALDVGGDSNEAVRRHVARLHEMMAAQVQKFRFIGVPAATGQDFAAQIEAEIDRLISGIGLEAPTEGSSNG